MAFFTLKLNDLENSIQKISIGNSREAGDKT
jgi:hypothetical protein